MPRRSNNNAVQNSDETRERQRRVKKKDADMPKRNVSPFMHFTFAIRPSIVAENPEMAFADRARHIASRWNVMTPEEREPYMRLAEQDKARYFEQIAEYKRKKESEQREKEEVEGPPLKRPCRNMSAFMHFHKLFRPAVNKQHPDWAFGRVAKFLGHNWEHMTAEQREPYVRSADSDRTRYFKELDEFRMRLEEKRSQNPEAVEQFERQRKGKKRMAKLRKGPKRNMSAYMHFNKLLRPLLRRDHQEWSFGDLARYLSDKWKNMSEVERLPYENLANHDRARYFCEVNQLNVMKLKAKTKKRVPPRRGNPLLRRFLGQRNAGTDNVDRSKDGGVSMSHMVADQMIEAPFMQQDHDSVVVEDPMVGMHTDKDMRQMDGSSMSSLLSYSDYGNPNVQYSMNRNQNLPMDMSRMPVGHMSHIVSGGSMSSLPMLGSGNNNVLMPNSSMSMMHDRSLLSDPSMLPGGHESTNIQMDQSNSFIRRPLQQ